MEKEFNFGCDYCNDPHPARDCVLPDGIERFLVFYNDGTKLLGKPFIYERQIKFCPMCGRDVTANVCDTND
jgi:hypothetical protein